MCEENKFEEETLPIEIINFCGTRCQFKGPYRKSRGTYQDDILKDDSL